MLQQLATDENAQVIKEAGRSYPITRPSFPVPSIGVSNQEHAIDYVAAYESKWGTCLYINSLDIFIFSQNHYLTPTDSTEIIEYSIHSRLIVLFHLDTMTEESNLAYHLINPTQELVSSPISLLGTSYYFCYLLPWSLSIVNRTTIYE